MKENTTKVLTKEDLKLQDLLREDLETIQAPVPYMEDVIDKDLREGLTERVEKEAGFKDNFESQLEMMIHLFQSESIDDMTLAADGLLTKTKEQFAENQKQILETIRPWEKVVRSLDLFFKNASSSGKVEDASFITVDPERFAGAANTAHFNIMSEELKNLYYDWEVDGSPLFISYVGDIGDGADLIAKIAEETVAMAVVDTVDCPNAKATLSRTKNRKLSGVESYWGHLVVSGTHLIGRGSYDGLEDEPLTIPSASAITGKLMNTKEGDSISGFEEGGLVGVKGVRYNSGTRESKEFGERGMIILKTYKDGSIKIKGDGTANKSTNNDLRKISKMIVRNKVMKDFVDFCNKKAFSKWGNIQRTKFKTQIEIYLNDLIRNEAIEGYEEVIIKDINEDEVSVTVALQFYKTISRYLIGIKGASIDTIEKV